MGRRQRLGSSGPKPRGIGAGQLVGPPGRKGEKVSSFYFFLLFFYYSECNSNELLKSFSLVIKTNHHKGKYAAACMHKHAFNLIINFNFSKIIISLSFHAHIYTQLNQILLFKIFQKFGCYRHGLTLAISTILQCVVRCYLEEG
jgi:hypothetical protein